MIAWWWLLVGWVPIVLMGFWLGAAMTIYQRRPLNPNLRADQKKITKIADNVWKGPMKW